MPNRIESRALCSGFVWKLLCGRFVIHLGAPSQSIALVAAPLAAVYRPIWSRLASPQSLRFILATDVVSLEKTDESFRLLYDSKGRFVLHRVSAEESKYKLLRVRAKAVGSKAAHGKNPAQNGRAGAIPYIVTHDARTIRFPDPSINITDTVKFDLTSNKIVGHHKFEAGNLVRYMACIWFSFLFSRRSLSICCVTLLGPKRAATVP